MPEKNQIPPSSSVVACDAETPLPPLAGGDSRASAALLSPQAEGDKKHPGNLSPALCAAIGDTLAAGEQVMLFVNRRGYAPIVQCKSCGWVAECPDCSVGMTAHKKLKINNEQLTINSSENIHLANHESRITSHDLICHICGRTAAFPKKCPECGSADISTRGAGLEKIAEEVAAKFPAARVALVSSDTMQSRQALERLVAQMESGEIDIVIGTQILAKGHHFPNLTLVGVIDADQGLFSSDFRAAEKTFQQLFQVAGRAGRGEKPGRVLLQTYQPEHPVLRAICAGNRDEFMRADLDGRAMAKMPPFGQLIAVIVEAEKESVLTDYCAKLAAAVPKIISQGESHNSLLGGRFVIPAQAGTASEFASRWGEKSVDGKTNPPTDPSVALTRAETSSTSPQGGSYATSLVKILGPIPAQMYQIRGWYRMRFLVSGGERDDLQSVVKHWFAAANKKFKQPANVRVKIDVNPMNFN